MTVTDRTAATEQEFRDRIAPFETAPTPPEVREAAVVEEVAFAIWGTTMRDEMTWEDWRRLRYEDDRRFYREQAAAAVAAYRAAQDGGAEEAVRRVEALCDDRSRARGFVMLGIDEVRAALAPQAGDGAR